MCLSTLASALLVPATLHNSNPPVGVSVTAEAEQDSGAQGSALPGTHMRVRTSETVRTNETPYPALGYRYVEFNAYSIASDRYADDEVGYELQASYPITEFLYARGLVGRSSLDIPVAAPGSAEQTRTNWGLGLGARYGFRSTVDLVGELLLTGSRTEFSLDGASSVDSSSPGYFARAGFRWQYRPSWEIDFDLRNAGSEGLGSEFGVGAGVRIRLTDALSLGLAYSSFETTNNLCGGLRFGW